MTSRTLSYTGHKWINPLWVVVPASVIIFALGWSIVGGFTGALLGGIGGLVWALLLGYIVKLINRMEKWKGWLATAVLLASGAILFLQLGGGVFEYMLLTKAIETSPEWITTITSGPLAEQVILYFIIFNSLLEIILVPLALLLNWRTPQRRVLVLVAGLIFYTIRIWTYLTFAPEYFAFGDMALSQQLVDQLKTRMAIDSIRTLMMVGEAVIFFCAALVPTSVALADSEHR